MRFSLLIVFVAALLAGCTGWPQNASEFREQSRMGPINRVSTFDVARPLAEVAATMRKQSSQCLSIRIKLTAVNPLGMKSDAGSITYKPTFISHANRAELHLQRKPEGTNEHLMGDVPPGGAYKIVMDATAVSANRTKIDIYRMSFGGTDGQLLDTFTHWAKGDNLGCPMLEN